MGGCRLVPHQAAGHSRACTVHLFQHPVPWLLAREAALLLPLPPPTSKSNHAYPHPTLSTHHDKTYLAEVGAGGAAVAVAPWVPPLCLLPLQHARTSSGIWGSAGEAGRQGKGGALVAAATAANAPGAQRGRRSSRAAARAGTAAAGQCRGR